MDLPWATIPKLPTSHPPCFGFSHFHVWREKLSTWIWEGHLALLIRIY